MKLRRNKTNTTEEAARFGARANAYLGVAQLIAGTLSGNIGFATEAAHQAADSFSLKAKADAMNSNCTAEKSYKLRRVAARILLAGGLAGVAGGAYHFMSHSSESSSPIAISTAVTGAAINTVIAKRSHGSHHEESDHTHAHHHGAAADSLLHIMTDMGTGWVYAGALMLENKIPGAANYALAGNGLAAGAAGVITLQRVQRDNAPIHSHTKAQV